MIVVFGSNGQIGHALHSLLGDRAKYFTRTEADFGQPEQVKALLEGLDPVPSAIINATAYTAVDKAEEEEALATCINAETPAIIAAYCHTHSIAFIHYSTDYVFPGSGETPWKETATPSPLNAYGRGKLQGEENIKKIGGKWLILRTSWVYDAKGKNFLNTMLRLGAERETLRVVNDQFGAPSFATHLAQATLDILHKAEQRSPFPSGIYHMCNAGVTSWHGFAEAIFSAARECNVPLALSQLEGIPTSAYPTPARRPLNSRLDCSKLREVFDIGLPSWQEGLHQAMKEKFLKGMPV